MKLFLEIRHNPTGYIATDIWPYWDYNEFWWTEGNAGCDCNRELFFLRAIGAPETDVPMCGEEMYSIRLSDANTNEVLYAEF